MASTSTSGTLRDGLWIKKVPSYYTPAQISKWLSRIRFEPSCTEQDISTGTFLATLENLYILMRLHLLAFPFENTAMHYTPDHSMDVSPEGAFRRLVLESKGSYCFGQNSLLLGMLRGLGYRAYAGASRVNQAYAPSALPEFSPLSHMIIFVQPIQDSNKTYLVDVGFGMGLTKPILLSNADDNIVIGTTPTEKHRLTRGSNLATSLERAQNTSVTGGFDWHLEALHIKVEDPTVTQWTILYSFSEEEHFSADFDSASFAVSMRPGHGIFWRNVLCAKHFVLGDEEIAMIREETRENEANKTAESKATAEGGSDMYLGRLVMMGGEIKRHVGSRSEVIRTVSTELERIRALREVFLIDISDDDERYIRGRDAALKSGNQATTNQ